MNERVRSAGCRGQRPISIDTTLSPRPLEGGGVGGGGDFGRRLTFAPPSPTLPPRGGKGAVVSLPRPFALCRYQRPVPLRREESAPTSPRRRVRLSPFARGV